MNTSPAQPAAQPDPAPPAQGLSADLLALVQQQVESLQFGKVQITLHDAKVVQLERLERQRLSQPNSSSTKNPSTS